MWRRDNSNGNSNCNGESWQGKGYIPTLATMEPSRRWGTHSFVAGWGAARISNSNDNSRFRSGVTKKGNGNSRSPFGDDKERQRQQQIPFGDDKQKNGYGKGWLGLFGAEGFYGVD